uniref:FAST kinase domains 2 n=1 Tax=Salvator merianae TaxID=96440 RepID=A0A8D0E5B2_SALMN
MNKKLSCLIRTVRVLQTYSYGVRPFSTASIRTLENNEKSIFESSNLRHPLYVPSYWLRTLVRFVSQDTLAATKENAEANKEKTVNALVDNDVLSPESVTDQASQSSSDFLSSSKIVASTAEEKNEKNQQFINELRKCSSACDVLDLYSEFPGSERFISTSFSTMWMLVRKFTDTKRSYEIQLLFQHPQFNQLCQCLMREAKFMWCDDLVYSFLAVVRLGVPQDSRLVQTLLRVCQERLNEFDDRCLSVIATTLQEMEKCSNLEALRAGMQLLVEQRIPKTSKVLTLQTMMRCVGKDAPLALKTKLENRIWKQMDQLTISHAHNMFTVLAEMDYPSVSILNACSNRVIENIQGTSFRQLLAILRSSKSLRYNNVSLFSAIADYTASVFYMWDTKQIVQFLFAFEGLNFRPVDLMDTFAETIIAHPELVTLKDILTVTRAYSALNHIPKGQNEQFLETLNTILNNYLPRIHDVNLLRIVYHFCILGYFPQLALNQLLQDEIVHDLLRSERHNTEQIKMMLHTINTCIELDGNSFIKPVVLPVRKLPSPSASDYSYAQEVLLALLGDKSLFRPTVSLEHDYNIDFEIIMDTKNRVVIPDTEVDQSNTERIALLFASMPAFCLGSRHPRGRVAMKMRHLNLLGYRVILVHYQEFKNLNKEAAIEFLKKEIFSMEAPGDSDPNIQND